MNVPSLPTQLRVLDYDENGKVSLYCAVPVPGLTGVPSGYARQAQLIADRTQSVEV